MQQCLPSSFGHTSAGPIQPPLVTGFDMSGALRRYRFGTELGSAKATSGCRSQDLEPIMRLALLATLAVIGTALTSCQTITPEERRAADQQSCARFGFRPGTDAMARCLLDIELDRRAERRAWRAE